MRPTKEQVRKMIGYGWDEEDAERGYVLADERIFDGNGNEQTVECVERIDEGGAYEGDVEASLQAAQDGVRMLFQDGDAMSQLPLRLDLYDGQLYLSLVNLNTGGEVLALTITDTAANRKALGILGASRCSSSKGAMGCTPRKTAATCAWSSGSEQMKKKGKQPLAGRPRRADTKTEN